MTSTPHDADHAFAYAYAYVQQSTSTSTRKSSAQGPTPTSDKRKLIEIQIRRFLACPKKLLEVSEARLAPALLITRRLNKLFTLAFNWNSI